MLVRAWILSGLVTIFLGGHAISQTPSPDPARIESLVRKLGSSSYLQREQARKELESIGIPALEPLRKFANRSDIDTARTIAALIRGFEDQVLTQQVLSPKEVHLKLKDSPVLSAITELANASGYPIQFQGDATRFADKKITLEGKMPFWQTFDQLCTQAGLMERVDLTNAGMPVPPLGGKRVMRVPFPHPIQPQMPTGPIIVTNRGNEKSFLSYAGAVKTEVRMTRLVETRELNLQFIVSTEPRLQNAGITGKPALDLALDQQGRKLSLVLDQPRADAKAPVDPAILHPTMVDLGLLPSSPRVTQIRVKEGPDAAKAIKELTGKLSMQVDLQNEVLARLDNVLESAGKSAPGANGGALKVVSVTKHANGHIEMQVSLENLGRNPFGGNIIMNGNGGVIIRGNIAINGGGIVIGPGGVRVNGGAGNTKDLPDLLDAKGQKFKLVGVSNDSFNMINNNTTRAATIVYQPTQGQAEPRQLVLFGTRTHTIGVPFRFENLPLP